MIKKLLKPIYRSLPWTLQDRIQYATTFRRLLRERPPLTFNEKVIARKWGECHTNDLYPILADKLRVREYVADRIGEKWLIPMRGATDDMDALATLLTGTSDVVVKPNHGAGMVRLVDAPLSTEEILELRQIASHWLETDYSETAREYHYRSIPRMIIVEDRIGVPGESLVDYKFHVFESSQGFSCVLQVVSDRKGQDFDRTFFIGPDFTRYSGSYPLSQGLVDTLHIAFGLSCELARGLGYARVDWYIHDSRLSFGEVTLTPAAGFGCGYGHELDVLMGNMWHSFPRKLRSAESELGRKHSKSSKRLRT